MSSEFTDSVSEFRVRSRCGCVFRCERLENEADFAAGPANGHHVGDGVPPDLAVHLLALHWNRQHFAFLITYRPRESGIETPQARLH